MTQVTSNGETDMDDAGLGRVIVVGSVVGIPLIFLVSLFLSLPGVDGRSQVRSRCGRPLSAGRSSADSWRS